MSLTTAVTTLMTRNLEKLGYPTDDIRWSLGYCQGDGSSFSGPIDIKVHGPRLVPEISKDLWPSIQCELKIERGSEHRYVHEYTVGLNIDAKCVEATEASEYGGVAQKYALHKLVSALEADIRSTAHKNSQDGYKVLESYLSEETRVWSFRTASFEVEVFKVRDEDHNPFEDEDVEYLDSEIKAVLEGDKTFFGTKVVVSLLDEDGEPSSVLAEEHVWGLSCDSSDATLGGARREVVSEAIDVAREAYQKMLRPKLKAAA